MAKFFLACLWTEIESRCINSQKKELGQCPAILTEQAWSIKNLLFGFRGNFSHETQQVIPSGQDGVILPPREANHSAPLFILPTHGANHIINEFLTLQEYNANAVFVNQNPLHACGSTGKMIVLFWQNNKFMVTFPIKNNYNYCNFDLVLSFLFQKFNEYLDELTEHYDIPKVSWTK